MHAQLLWRYSKGVVALRLRYLQQCEGVQARTALVQDIPGVHFGTLMHRADTTVLRVLPGIIKEPLKKTVSRVVDVGNKGLKATTGRIADNLANRCCPLPTARCGLLKRPVSAQRGAHPMVPLQCSRRSFVA